MQQRGVSRGVGRRRAGPGRVGLVGVILALGILVSQTATSADPERTTAATATMSAQRLDPPRTLVVTAGGDILPELVVRDAARRAGQANGTRYDFTPMFAGVLPAAAEADLAICHMELPIGDPGAYVGVTGDSPFGGKTLIAPYELAAGVRNAGFGRCSTASNHSYDTGDAGIRSTLDALDAVGISHTGTARTPAEATPTVFDVNGVRVGHVAYTRYSNVYRQRDAWRQNFPSSTAPVIADVAALRAAGAEIVIVSLHLLKEMLPAPTSYDREFTTLLTQASQIDLVVHHGAHVIQPVEMLNGTLVYWSVGNMVSGMGVAGRGRYEDPRTLDGLMATVDFLETSDGGWTARPRTVTVCTDPVTRLVRAATFALSDPAAGLDGRARTELEQCLARTLAVVGHAR